MAQTVNLRHILISGTPGIGKTTLIRKVVENLKNSKEPFMITGFFTEELRQDGIRKGFDVVTLDDKRSVLSRKSEFVQSTDARNMPKVGQYCVDVKSFEERALPTLAQCEAMHIFVVDEIGKMEVFSSKFCTAIRRVFDSKNAVILATVPVAKGKSLQIVEEIKARPDCNLIMVTKANRDSLIDEVTGMVQQLYDAHSK